MGALQNYKLSWLEKTKSINECVFWSIWVGLEICWFSPLEQLLQFECPLKLLNIFSTKIMFKTPVIKAKLGFWEVIWENLVDTSCSKLSKKIIKHVLCLTKWPL